MSSPPLDFPSSDMDDIQMDDNTASGMQTQSMPEAPPRDPLFLAGTPSVANTPVRQRYEHSSPLRGATARRALEMATPKRTPLFMGKNRIERIHINIHTQRDILPTASSSPIAFPSSSPAKKAQRRGIPQSDAPQDSDPLDFPSCV
jgi:DNA replication licensing factor MCM4